MGVSCIVDPIAGKMDLLGEKMFRIIWGLESIQRHSSNRLYMSADEYTHIYSTQLLVDSLADTLEGLQIMPTLS